MIDPTVTAPVGIIRTGATEAPVGAASRARRPALALVLALASGAAVAQPVDGLAPAGATVLRLSETASLLRAPDEGVATLRVEARGAGAAAVQAAVNAAMAAALERARAVPGVSAATGAYRTGRTQEPRGWVASQALVLRAAADGALPELVGQLQERGLALSDLGSRLSATAARAARDEATAAALDGLGARAAAIAARLGLRVGRLAEVVVEAPEEQPRPALAQMAARAAPAPVVQAEDVPVSVTVRAAAILVAP